MRLRIFIACAFLMAPAVWAQQPALDLTVKSSIGQAMSYSAVEISTELSRFTDETGHLLLSLSPASYRIRIKHLGYKATDTTVVISPAARTTVTVTLDPIVVHVSATEIRGRTSCRILSENDTELGRIVGELRKNAERERLLRNSYPFLFRLAREFEVGDVFGVTKQRDTVEYPSITNDPYIPGQMVREAYKPAGSATRELRIPTLVDLADDRFLSAHCFYYRGIVKQSGVRAHRIDFEPVPGLRFADVRGSAFLDADSYVIRRAVFSLVHGELVTPPVYGMDVTTTYREIFPGLALMDFVRGVQQVARGLGKRGERVEEQKLIAVEFIGRMPGS